jgi:predicted Zn finger-like uncharacterized protein
MRFACDACHAQYLIADEKVGPAGVKVRCKKCGHVIVVRRSAAARTAAVAGTPEGVAAAPGSGAAGTPGQEQARAASGDVSNSPGEGTPGPAPAGDAAGGPGETTGAAGESAAGADRESDLAGAVGAAVDGLLAGAGAAAGEGGVPDPETTRIVSTAEISRLARKAEGGEPSEPPAEWFVAIDDRQVGPISFGEVKRHWEEGRLDPDSLCWRAGLSDWTPIARVAELFDLLPAKASPAAKAPVAAVAAAPAAAESPADSPWDLPPPEPTSELEWKPAAASALSALVEREVAAMGAGRATAAARQVIPEEVPPPESTGIRTLLSNLPEPPPPEPSRVIPFPERSQTGSQALPRPPRTEPMPVAQAPRAGASSAKNAMIGGVVAAALVVLVAVGLAWAGILPWGSGAGETPAPAPAPVAAAPAVPAAPAAPSPAVPPVAEVPAPTPAPDPAAVPGAVPAPAPGAPAAEAAVPAPAPEATAAATPPPAPEAAPPPVAPAAEVAAAEEPPRPVPAAPEPRRTTRRERRVAAARPPPPAPTPAPAPEPKPQGRRSDIDALFEQEFAEGGAATSRQGKASPRDDVYIPAAPGSRSKPARLGQSDVMAVVVSHKAEIKKCADQYKASGGGSGTLVMLWTIQQSGKTAHVRPKTAAHAPLAKCIGGLIRGWKFPEYSGPTMAPIEFPFQF